MTNPISRKRTNSALSDEAHIRPVGLRIDDGRDFAHFITYCATWGDRG